MGLFSRSGFLVAAGLAFATAAHAGVFEDALTATYQNNPRIKAARQQLEATDEGVSQALSGFRPTVDASYDRGKQSSSVNGASSVDNTTESRSLNVSQPLLQATTWSSYLSANQKVKAGQYALSATEQAVLLDAVTAYMDVVANHSILELSRNNADVLAKQLDAAQARFKVGEVTRTDVAQSESRLSDAKSAVIAAEGTLNSAMATFERVVGFKPETQLVAPEKLPELPASLAEALTVSRANNPDLLAAIHTAKSSRFDTDTQEATLLPSVALVGSLSRQEGNSATTSGSKLDQDKIGVEVSIPLYQSGAEYSRIRAAASVARQRDQQSIDTRMAVDESITQSWAQLETANATIRSRNDQIKAAEIALDGVKQEHEYGSRTLLDVLDAEQELFTARSNLVKAERDRVVAVYTLAGKLGQLTPTALALNVTPYDPREHADEVKWQMIGY